MDRLEFGKTKVGHSEAAFGSGEEIARSYAREDADQKINLRTLQVWPPIGDSFFQ